MRDQELVIAESELAPNFCAKPVRRIRRKEIGDHYYLIAEPKGLFGLAPQTLGHGGDGIGMNEGVLDRGAVLRVWAQQSGVGPVQGRHDFRRRGPDHFRGEKRRGRMGHCVMDVEKIEALCLTYFRHLHRQRQRVIRTGKDRGVADLDLVEMNSRAGQIEANGAGVAKEVDVVAARGQLHPESRSEYPAPADQRKTGDPDLERRRHF